MAINFSNSDKPIVSLVVNVDDVMHEVVDILQAAKEEIGIVTRAVNERMNASMKTTMDDVVHIMGNTKIITENLAQTTGSFYQPVFIVILLLLIVLILLVILFLIILKTRREYKKRPIKIIQRLKRDKGKSKVEPQHTRRSTSVLSAEEGRSDPAYSEKKRNDTLV